MGDFEVDTRVQVVDKVGASTTRLRARLSPDWEIWGPNGGYLAALALRAAGEVCRIPRPTSFSAHFLGIGRFEDVEIHVEELRMGRRAESLRISIVQEGRTLVESWLRTAAVSAGLEHTHARAPSVPRPEDLVSSDELRDPDQPGHPFWQNIESRPLDPDSWRGPRRARDPELCEWFRFRPRPTFEDPFVDAGRSLLLLDTLTWPAASGPHLDSGYRAPNLDVSVWFHASAPGSEWLLTEHSSPIAAGGLMGTVGRVWSREGVLLASGGAQLLCIPAEPE